MNCLPPITRATRLAPPLLARLMLTACQTTDSAGTDGARFCDAAKVIAWSKADTRPTQEQAVEHNAVGKALCGWGAKR